jgi:HSP90 family molecular chaperone
VPPTACRRDALLALSRFKSTASGEGWRSLKDYVGALKENQTAIYYLAGDVTSSRPPRRCNPLRSGTILTPL